MIAPQEGAAQRDELRLRLIRWHEWRIEAQRDPVDLDDWTSPRNLEAAWSAWTLLESTGWRHLLDPGGLLDQPEGLMCDVALIAWLSSVVEKWISKQ